MAKLQYMEYQDETEEEVEVRIIDEVKANWMKLVDSLELPARTVDSEKAKPGWTPYEACRSVFITWLGGEGTGPRTWSTVLKALKRMGGYKELIKRVKLALEAEYRGKVNCVNLSLCYSVYMYIHKGNE